MTWKHQQDSFTYVEFVFKDKNVRRFYSLDWRHKLSKYRDRELGLKRLRALIAKWAPYTDEAYVRENDGSEKIIEYYEEGVRVERVFNQY